MPVKEMIKRLKRYPETAEVCAVHVRGSSFTEGFVETNFDICSRKSVSKRTVYVGDGFKDDYGNCDVVILL